jgi:hypothetical protein
MLAAKKERKFRALVISLRGPKFTAPAGQDGAVATPAVFRAAGRCNPAVEMS